jgi:hypothetical protein
MVLCDMRFFFDAIQTSVSATFPTRVVCDGAVSYRLQASSRIVIVRLWCSEAVLFYFDFVPNQLVDRFSVRASVATGLIRLVRAIGFMQSVASVGDQS